MKQCHPEFVFINSVAVARTTVKHFRDVLCAFGTQTFLSCTINQPALLLTEFGRFCRRGERGHVLKPRITMARIEIFFKKESYPTSNSIRDLPSPDFNCNTDDIHMPKKICQIRLKQLLSCVSFQLLTTSPPIVKLTSNQCQSTKRMVSMMILETSVSNVFQVTGVKLKNSVHRTRILTFEADKEV